MKIVMTPNPYRDRNFKYVEQAVEILQKAGAETKICLPFDVDKNFELPKTVRFFDIHREIKNADLLICFGGDGTILHASKIATRHHVPILGVNIGTMGFMAELEAGELELLSRLPANDYRVEKRMMLRATVRSEGKVLFDELALNDAAITKGAIARVIQLSVECDGVEATAFSGDGVIVSTPHRLHGLLHVRRRPHCGALGAEYHHHPHLRPCHPCQEHRHRALAHHHRADGKAGAAQCLPLGGRRPRLPPQRGRRGDHPQGRAGDAAGAAEGYQLLPDHQQ